MIASKAKCLECKTKFYYAGYPAYFACPNCESINVELILRKQKCKCCNGTGRIKDIVEKEFDDVINNDKQAMKFAKKTMIK